MNQFLKFLLPEQHTNNKKIFYIILSLCYNYYLNKFNFYLLSKRKHSSQMQIKD